MDNWQIFLDGTDSATLSANGFELGLAVIPHWLKQLVGKIRPCI
jgi:hypothetical protein